MRRSALALLAALLAAPGRGEDAAAAPEALVAPLFAGELLDPDLLPPDLLLPLEQLATSGLAPAPASATVRKTGLVLDWDGDGRAERTIRGGGSGVVRVPKGAGQVPLAVLDRAGAWWVGPAAVLATKAGGPVQAMLLDADLDGRHDGPADRVRFGEGAFMPLVEPRRAPVGGKASLWALVGEGDRRSISFEPELQSRGAGPVELAGLTAVNAFRNRSGLGPLALDIGWCRGCRQHAEYILLNPADGFGHSETPGRPGYSEEGLTAAIEGVMERTGDPAAAVESLTAMMMHRTPFLADPTARLGVGVSRTQAPRGEKEAVQGAGYCVLRAGQALSSHAWPVLVPAPGQRDVPLAAKAEVPEPDRHPAGFYASPRGYPVSVSFLGAAQRPIALSMRTVASGAPVAAFLFTPAAPIHASLAHNYATAFLLPEKPLEPATTYEVQAVAGEGPAARRLVWRFTTRRP